MEDTLVKNTLMFKFPDGAMGPSLIEVARFVKSLNAETSTMESSYKISEERCICIKFRNEDAMKNTLLNNPENHVFEYSNGNIVEIKMSIAGGCTKYIRIFDLPPEVPDYEIAAVLSKFGKVRRQVREKFPAQLELDLYTGVRGAYVEIKTEIPATLFFLNRRGRVYYEGLKFKCFQCKEEGHIKADCPRIASKSKENTDDNSEKNDNSYAAMLKKGNVNHQSKLSTFSKSQEIKTKMTVLTPANRISDATSNLPTSNGATEMAIEILDEQIDKDEQQLQVEISTEAQNGDDNNYLAEPIITADEMEFSESESGLITTKRQHEGSSLETSDEEVARNPRSRKVKKDVDLLNIIAREPSVSKRKSKRNK